MLAEFRSFENSSLPLNAFIKCHLPHNLLLICARLKNLQTMYEYCIYGKNIQRQIIWFFHVRISGLNTITYKVPTVSPSHRIKLSVFGGGGKHATAKHKLNGWDWQECVTTAFCMRNFMFLLFLKNRKHHVKKKSYC